MSDNDGRIAAAEAAIAAYLEAKNSTPDTDETDLIDLLSDLHHYAHAADIDIEAAMETAKEHYDAEMICECGRQTEDCATFDDADAEHGDR